MKVDLSKKDLSLKDLIIKLRMPLLVFFGGIFVLSFILSKAHPEKVSHAKDFSYLYSLGESWKAGREISETKLTKKLSKFPELKQEFDAFYIERAIENENFDELEGRISEIRGRVSIDNALVKRFTDASLAIERGDYESGYEICRAIYNEEALKEDYPTLYAYNLFRLYELEKKLDQGALAEVTGKELSAFLESDGVDTSIDRQVKKIFINCLKGKVVEK